MGTPEQRLGPGSGAIRLRDIALDDLGTLFEHESDPEASRMAVVNPRDAAGFRAHWERILAERTSVSKAILDGDELVGRISCFPMEGVSWVGYWIAREHWGRGIATRALELLLREVATRPLHARVAMTNPGSIRVLEKCGFVVTGHRHCPADERFPACEEAVLRLD